MERAAMRHPWEPCGNGRLLRNAMNCIGSLRLCSRLPQQMDVALERSSGNASFEWHVNSGRHADAFLTNPLCLAHKTPHVPGIPMAARPHLETGIARAFK